MENVSTTAKEDEQIELPPGFRFHPTDEELITHYLSPKVLDANFSAVAIGEVDLNKCEPWDLPWRAKMGEREWYFFCVRDRKYPTGLRTNRATDAGYWKATGKDKEIYKGKTLVGMKKTLVFYKGRAPKGEKSNWVMHEYRLEGKYSGHNLPKTARNEWVICRAFNKISGGKKTHISGLTKLSPYANESRPSLLPPLMDSSPYNSETRIGAGETSHVTCFSSPVENHKTKEHMVDNFNTSLLAASPSSNPSHISSAPNSAYYTNMGNLQYSDTALMQDQLFRMLFENHAINMKQNMKAEFSSETGFSTDMSSMVSNHDMARRSFEDQDDPSTSGGPVDIDCLWNY